ncbi:HIRAN domain-containing protein [Microbacterium sp. K27]|uniref:HIRAN domain-containing protein n=1 Tax=Microbacterium sp. K27 TaxID=2305445 RepID=UPI00109BAA21|nr:HIRAN domain-containing protein [Microbacterium sp. K27]
MGFIDAVRGVLGMAPVRQSEPERPSTRVSSPARTATPHARTSGATHESAYLPEEDHARLLQPGHDGLPPLALVRRNGALWLAETSTGKLINVDNRYLRRLGIFGVKVRGTRYYNGTAKLGPAELVREPDNPHDPNAIAIHVDGEMLGHYNKGTARSLAKRLDAGEPLQAMVISADPAKVIAAPTEILRHLYRDF